MSRNLIWAAAGAAALVTVSVAYFVFFGGSDDPSMGHSTPGYKWEPVVLEVPTDETIRIAVRITDTTTGQPVVGAQIMASRIDMGPDGMGAMDAPLTPTAASEPGVYAFDTKLTMGGRWALALTAKVPGRSDPITGVVIFNAVEKQSGAPTEGGDRKIVYYRNPMGLADVSPVPKKDSMGMDYIPVYADEVAGADGSVRISVEKVQRAGVRTEVVSRRVLSSTVRASGVVVEDEHGHAMVTAKFSGFVEDLHATTTGTVIKAGEPLLRVWIESPELLRRQADYLVALRGPKDSPNIATARNNLRLFDISESSLAELRNKGEAIRDLTIASPIDGTVVEKKAITGMRFEPGDMLYKIVDLSTVWVIAEVPEGDLHRIGAGLMAQITLRAYPGAPSTGVVEVVYPELSMATRTAKVRIDVPNPGGRIKLGMFADVSFDLADAETVVAIPESAVVDSGQRTVAFVSKGDGLFEPRNLKLGQHGDDYVEVLEGINEGERVVTAGNFLIDAESNLRSALAAFAPPG